MAEPAALNRLVQVRILVPQLKQSHLGSGGFLLSYKCLLPDAFWGSGFPKGCFVIGRFLDRVVTIFFGQYFSYILD